MMPRRGRAPWGTVGLDWVFLHDGLDNTDDKLVGLLDQTQNKENGRKEVSRQLNRRGR